MKAIICLHIGAAARNYKGKADKMHPKASLPREVDASETSSRKE